MTTGPLYITADVWYVHAATGTDAAAPAGKERNSPLATLSQAYTNAADGDVIVFLDGHEETLTVAQVIAKRLTLVGSGQSGGRPTVKFTSNAAAAYLFDITVDGVELRNLWFEENLQANSAGRIRVSGSLFRMIGCYVECDGNDDDNALALEASGAVQEIRNTTFVSTATAASDAPVAAVFCQATMGRLILDGVVFDGGTVGFALGYAFEQEQGGATSILICEDISLLRGADMRLIQESVGWVVPATRTGNPRIDWTGSGPA